MASIYLWKWWTETDLVYSKIVTVPNYHHHHCAELHTTTTTEQCVLCLTTVDRPTHSVDIKFSHMKHQKYVLELHMRLNKWTIFLVDWKKCKKYLCCDLADIMRSGTIAKPRLHMFKQWFIFKMPCHDC